MGIPLAKWLASGIVHLVGGFNPSEKYESHLGLLLPIYLKKHVPNHQPVMIGFTTLDFLGHFGIAIPIPFPSFRDVKITTSSRSTKPQRLLFIGYHFSSEITNLELPKFTNLLIWVPFQ